MRMWFCERTLVCPTKLTLVIVATLSAPTWSQGLFVSRIRVQRESTLDWAYAARQLGVQPPFGDAIKRYRSEEQRYDFYGPRRAPSRSLPLILFVSPGKVPLEWRHFAPACQRHGILFAGIRGAGNTQDAAIRVRVAVDVLDDVRRRYHVDPDRTYVAGFSGGAVVASRLAFALPECFGGLLCIGQRILPPASPAQTYRCRERIDIAALCGGNEYVGPEVEHLDSAAMTARGFRCRAFVSRRLGHRMPDATVIDSAIKWLEAGLDRRRELAQRYATTRIDLGKSSTAKDWPERLLKEAEQRQGNQDVVASHMLLRWIRERWPESEAAEHVAILQSAQGEADLAAINETVTTQQQTVAAAHLDGYEALANDRRSWFTNEKRGTYALLALRHLAHSPELDANQERARLLKAIARKGKRDRGSKGKGSLETSQRESGPDERTIEADARDGEREN